MGYIYLLSFPFSLAPQQVHKVLICDIFFLVTSQIKSKATEVERYIFHGQINIGKGLPHRSIMHDSWCSNARDS